MLYPTIPKGKLKGTYIGGGIFAILLGLPMLILFMSQFCLVAFGNSLWDLNNLGLNINLEFLNAVRLYAIYLALPLLLFFINFIGMFIGVSRSALFVKGASLAFIVSFILQHGLWIIDLNEATLQTFSYIAMALVVIGGALLVCGIVFRFLQSEQLKEHKANSFLIFTSCFLFVTGLLDSFGNLLAIPTDVIAWLFPLLMGFYGVSGGLWMLLTCRRSTLYEEAARKNKTVGFEPNNLSRIQRGNAGFQPKNIPPQSFQPQNIPQQNISQQNVVQNNIPNNAIQQQEAQKINPQMVKIQPTISPVKNQSEPKTQENSNPKSFPPRIPSFPPKLPQKMPPRLPPKLPPKMPPKTNKTTKEGE